MPLPKISEAREFSDEQLGQEIVAVKKELFQLRLQQATRQLDKPHLFRHARHRLAQLMTVEGERKRASSSQQAKESN
ncbi:MAG: 50S ribosomal protein L29 [Brasilonema octagenarum HA4186-MV1]|jgi:large subunit ribosomal protein L29|uniref:Large ribosomal subunit protein uL29 n=2 Tax=Brasilonema TaxID=383614 RepID=A0A856MCJ9_9CYAN|nr:MULTISPECIES: 50S ribosomal protein L29 [Brasilonema]MBW4624379.1 50S ribosomal protein L29 [Brasilonema octagenarum HA4186-MV1]NMF63670.1 50S ribosomal protein L29 [Brasilonema octagenarum UFV-OR1]QDL09015.1 50S ribosomal protein L29 [Brasilonema sennae CENA114]QDL15372.1 50S ribosomal protein L29 [Brasilonema octagenarum UFV-E1]